MRTFVAIDLSQTIRRQMAGITRRLSNQCTGLRWVDPDNAHLTVKFLGEIQAERLPEVSRVLNQAGALCDRFSILFQDVGVFDPQGPLRVVWLGVDDHEGGLARLQNAVETSLGEIGFAPERRPFRPHLTLARNRSPRNRGAVMSAIESLGSVHFGEMAVESIVLYQSVRAPRGAEYTALSRHGLGAT